MDFATSFFKTLSRVQRETQRTSLRPFEIESLKLQHIYGPPAIVSSKTWDNTEESYDICQDVAKTFGIDSTRGTPFLFSEQKPITSSPDVISFDQEPESFDEMDIVHEAITEQPLKVVPDPYVDRAVVDSFPTQKRFVLDEDDDDMELFDGNCGPMPRRNRKQVKKRRVKRQIPRTMLDVLPPHDVIKLTSVFNYVINNATVLIPYGYAYVNCSQPLVSDGGAATVIPRWAELTSRYRKYRVWNSKIRASIVNQEAYGIDFFVCPMGSLLPQTVANCRAALSNMRAVSHIVSGVGSPNQKVLHKNAGVSTYAGVLTRHVEDLYAGSTDGTSLIPTDNFYFMIGTDTNGVASVSGTFVSVKMTWIIDLWEPQNAIN